jgi:hypothetical protein
MRKEDGTVNLEVNKPKKIKKFTFLKNMNK